MKKLPELIPEKYNNSFLATSLEPSLRIIGVVKYPEGNVSDELIEKAMNVLFDESIKVADEKDLEYIILIVGKHIDVLTPEETPTIRRIALKSYYNIKRETPTNCPQDANVKLLIKLELLQSAFIYSNTFLN